MMEYSVWLSLIKGVTKRKKAALLEAFGSAAAVYDAGKADLYSAVPELTASELDCLWEKDLRPAYRVLEACRRCGAQVIDRTHPRFPAMLNEIADPPTVLYVRGELPDLQGKLTVAIVGQRKASAAGLKHASQMAYELSRSGAVVISGMAAGIDGAAHRGALDGGTPTIAVLGTPINKCYPAEHTGLMEEIIRHGAVLSEYAPGAQTFPGSFLSRNRIVSGMSRGILVVEAGYRSGALETAGKGLEQNRDIFAVPGPIDSPDYVGTNNLIKDGAYAVTSAADILRVYGAAEEAPAPRKLRKKPVRPPKPEEEITENREKTAQKPLSIKPVQPAAEAALPMMSNAEIAALALQDEEGAILAAIGRTAHLDEIIERTGLPAGQVMVGLTMLELQGKVSQRPGNYYEKQR